MLLFGDRMELWLEREYSLYLPLAFIKELNNEDAKLSSILLENPEWLAKRITILAEHLDDISDFSLEIKELLLAWDKGHGKI